MKTVNYNDYSHDLAREFSGSLQKEWKVKTNSSRNLIHAWQVMLSTAQNSTMEKVTWEDKVDAKW